MNRRFGRRKEGSGSGFSHSNSNTPKANTSSARWRRNLSREPETERRTVTNVFPDGGAPRNRSQRVTNQHGCGGTEFQACPRSKEKKLSGCRFTHSNVVVIDRVGGRYCFVGESDRETYIRCISFVGRGLVVGGNAQQGSQTSCKRPSCTASQTVDFVDLTSTNPYSFHRYAIPTSKVKAPHAFQESPVSPRQPEITCERCLRWFLWQDFSKP